MMSDVYDKERTAALIKEARQLTADLKIETEKIRIEMSRVLDGDEDKSCEVLDDVTVAHDADFSKVTPPKFFWRFWR